MIEFINAIKLCLENFTFNQNNFDNNNYIDNFENCDNNNENNENNNLQINNENNNKQNNNNENNNNNLLKILGINARKYALELGWEGATSILRNIQYQKTIFNFNKENNKEK